MVKIGDKILLEDGTLEIPSKSVLYEGRWLSTGQWLEETAGNVLPLHEPLKSIISNKIALKQLV
jgi:hypothetical protein